MSGTSNTGKHIESAKGYSIYGWTGPQVDAGEMLPFSVSPRGSFDWKRFASLEEARAYVASSEAVRVAKVSFEVVIPVEATEDEIEDWIRFELHENGSLDADNPLMDHGLEARDVWIDSISDEA